MHAWQEQKAREFGIWKNPWAWEHVCMGLEPWPIGMSKNLIPLDTKMKGNLNACHHACVPSASGGHKGQAHMNKGFAPTPRGSNSRARAPLREAHAAIFSLSLLFDKVGSPPLSLACGQSGHLPLSLGQKWPKWSPPSLTSLKGSWIRFPPRPSYDYPPPSWMKLIG